MSKLSLGEDANLQGARVRRAWAAVSLYFKQSEQDRSRISASDLDALLSDSELRDLKSAFWRRYKLRFPPEVHPADATISRVTRELTKRMLCVYNIWRVKSLQFQQATTQKKRKIADSLIPCKISSTDATSPLSAKRSWRGGDPRCTWTTCRQFRSGNNPDQSHTASKALNPGHTAFLLVWG